MKAIAVTKISPKGTVTIPQDIMAKLHLQKDSQFAVFRYDNTLILKEITPAFHPNFDTFIKQARKYGKQVGLKKTDVQEAIKKVRQKNQ